MIHRAAAENGEQLQPQARTGLVDQGNDETGMDQDEGSDELIDQSPRRQHQSSRDDFPPPACFRFYGDKHPFGVGNGHNLTRQCDVHGGDQVLSYLSDHPVQIIDNVGADDEASTGCAWRPFGIRACW